MGENLELSVNESSRMSFTIFIKGARPDQIQRNSQRKKEEFAISEQLRIEVALKSIRMNKIYTIE